MKRKFLSLLLALAVISAMIMAVPVTGYAESTVTVYNFSNLTDDSYSFKNNTKVSLFDGAISLYSTGSNAGESASLVSLSADITYDSNTIKCTKILSGKSLCFDIKLNAGDKLTVYYCGCNNGASTAKPLTMTIQYNNTTKQTETNAEGSGIKPYTISYPADVGGTYSVISDTTNRTGIYAVVVESTSTTTTTFGDGEAVTGYYTENNDTSDDAAKNYVARFYQTFVGSGVTEYGFYVLTSDGEPAEDTDWTTAWSINSSNANEITAGFYATVKGLDNTKTYYAKPYVVTTSGTEYGNTIKTDWSDADSNHVKQAEATE